ncbi:hypothetical protein PV04_08746 [Phialophora macrospora]|uniref:B30.2/SPRY domain-containing protein n=1 Tax=Phialophora macrospora TaxID=1851006 RepID=A0A0D2F720_9EURO|nr:hypothetical protein PV04_08746 [Phialophora macrospora]
MAANSHLVLVHGITDWRADSGESRAGAFFSKRYPDSAVIEFDFLDHSTKLNRGSDFLRERAKALLDRLKGLPLSPVVFIGHGLGGSLIKKASSQLTKRRHVFFGTPHKSKDTLAWEHQVFRLLSISDSPAIKPAELLQVLPQALEDLYVDYATISHAYGVVCVSEKCDQGPNSSPVVDPALAVFDNGSRDNIELSGSHLDLWRFQSGDQAIEVVCQRIEALLRHGLQDTTFPRKAFLQALSRVDPETHQLGLTKAAPGTLDWIYDHHAFVAWMKTPQAGILHVCGPPGSGTTVITSQLLRMLLEREGCSNAVIASFTFNKQHIHARTLQSLILSLSRQLLSARPSLFFHVQKLCAALSNSNLYTQENLLPLLSTLLERSCGTPVICIIHAIHECETSLQHVIAQLERLVGISEGFLKVIVSGEDPHDTGHDYHPRIYLGAADTEQFIIKQFAQTSFGRLIERNPRWKVLEKDINEALCTPSTSYLLAQRKMNLLLEPDARTTLVAMRKKVMDLPGSFWVQSALRWIVHAARPLTRSELAVAVAFEELGDQRTASGLDELVSSDIVNDLNQVVGPLFKVVDDRVYLIHRSFRNFLTRGLDEKYLDEFNHNLVLTECLQYLEEFGKPSLCLNMTGSPTVAFDLVEYATVYWPVHRLLSKSDPGSTVILSTFLRAENVESWSKLYEQFRGTEFPSEPLNTSFLIGCRFGFPDLVAASIPEVKSAHDSDDTLQKGLNIAARYGHGQVVKFLIQESATSDLTMSLAVQSGVFEVVSTLLSVHPDVETMDSQGWTPLHHSSARGNEAITSLLLKVIADPDVLTSDQSTPLHLAATTGQFAIVQMLVGAQANVMLPDGSGCDALKLAAQSGFSDIVQCLVQNHADVKAASPDGATALHVAVEFGHLSTAQILLQHGGDIHAPNGSQLTPVHLAAKKGFLDILKLLLDALEQAKPATSAEFEETNELSIMTKFQIDEEEEESPLQLAARAGHIEIVRELLRRHVIDEDRKKDISVAVYRSAVIGYGAVVKVLLDHDANCIAEDEDGNTALHLAASRGHSEVLTQFLERPQFNINEANSSGWTTLHKAAELGNVEIVRKILARKPDLGSRTNSGSTPLHIAAQGGNLATLRVLISELDTSQECDNDDKTPFSLAVEAGQTNIVRELLSTYDIDHDNSYPFHNAARAGHIEVIKIFLENAWDVNQINASSQTLLHLACWSPDPLALVDLLLDADPDVNAKDDDLETPLSYTARSGTADVAKALLKVGANINSKDKYDSTPLFRASNAGNVDVVKELLGWEPAPDLNIQNKERGWTALHAAYDNPEVTRLLLAAGASSSVNDNDGDPPMLLSIIYGYSEVFKCYLKVALENHGVGGESISAAVRCAIEEGREEILQLLIEHGADVHAENERGTTALHVAAHEGRFDLLQMLIERGANVHKISEHRGSALMAAAQASALDCVKLLLESGAEVNAEGGRYHSALQAAAVAGDPEVIKVLLEHKADPNMVGGEFGTALLAASSTSNTEPIHLLLEAGADPNEKGGRSESPLQKAAFTGTADIVELLLERGARVNDRGGSYGSALNAAIEQGNLDCAELLLNHGADPNLSVSDHPRPVQIAARKDLLEIMKLLIERGADPEVLDEGGRTITMVALAWNSHSIVEHQLKRQDIDLDKKDAAGRTPLMIGVRQGSDFVETLLKKGADPNSRDWQEKTPLIQAVMKDFYQAITPLLAYGADPALVDARGRGPLYWACYQGSIETFDSILGAMKATKECSKHCERAIHAAVAANRSDFISKLLGVQHTRPNEAGEDNWTPIYTAQRFGYGPIAAQLISAGAIDTDFHDLVGRRRFPSKWDPFERSASLRVSPDGLIVETGGPFNPDNMSLPCGVILADSPMPGQGTYYFEVKIDKAPDNGMIGVGFCEENCTLYQMLGWNQGTWGYHGDDGGALNGGQRDGNAWGPEYTTGDVIGCGVNFEEEIAFYTKNGDVLGRAFTGIRGKLYPAISLYTAQKDVAVSVTFWDGIEDHKDVFKYKGSWEAPATREPPVPRQVDVKDDDD